MFVFYDWPFPHICTLRRMQPTVYSLLILGSVFSDCVVFYGDMFCCAVNKFVLEDRLPHLLLYGPPGTGKTSTILAVARQIYTPKEFNSMVLEVGRIG